MTDARVPQVSIRPGDVISLAEDDYEYGRGRIVLRVTSPHVDTASWFGGEWMWLDGVEIRLDGSDGPSRRVLVRIAALARSR